MKMTYRYISCITAEWKLPSVVKNSSLMRPNTSGALHTSSCNQGSTAPHKWPFYMTVLWTDLHYTDNHSPHCCDVLRPPANRAASEAVVSHKRRGIPSAQALRCLPNTWRHVTDVQQWLREWRLAINVSKNMAMLFAEADRRIPKTRPVQLLGSQSIGLIPSVIWRWPSIHGFYLVDSYHLVEKESGADTGSVGTSPKQEKWSLHQEWSSAVQAAHPSYDGLLMPRLEVCQSLPYQENGGASVHVSLRCYQCNLVHR